MYPPFHVRNLYEEHGGIVQLGAAEYDSLAKEPEARLTYVDDDDGEIITVSLETCSALTSLLTPVFTGWHLTRAPGTTLGASSFVKVLMARRRPTR